MDYHDKQRVQDQLLVIETASLAEDADAFLANAGYTRSGLEMVTGLEFVERRRQVAFDKRQVRTPVGGQPN